MLDPILQQMVFRGNELRVNGLMQALQAYVHTEFLIREYQNHHF